MPLPGVNLDSSKLGINADYSQNLGLDTKVGFDSLKNVVSSGIDKLSSTVNNLFSGTAKSLNLPTAFPKGDLPAAKNNMTPSAAPESKPKNIPAGALFFPVDQKYYALFTFNKYERIVANEAPKEKTSISIVLPMPSNLQESFNVDYETPALGAVAGSAADSLIKGLRSAQGAGTSQGSTVDKNAGESFTAALGAGAIYGISKIPKIGDQASNVARLATGVTPNPYLAVIFKNVDLRTHSFQYRFAPRSIQELQTLKKIIKELKVRMLPGMTKGSDMLFTFPDTCDITFGPTKDVPYNIKKCVMTSLNINYSPNGPAFFKTGDPVIVDISMSFKEISPYTRLDAGEDRMDVKQPPAEAPPEPPNP